MRAEAFIRLPIIICGVLLALNRVVAAAPANPNPPSGPLLSEPGNFARWEIIFTRPEGGSKAKDKRSRKQKSSGTGSEQDPPLRKLVTTKTGQVFHEERTNVLNETTDVWSSASTQYTKSSRSPLWIQLSSDNPTSRTGNQPSSVVGYRDVEIIKAENYVGTIPYNKRPCLIFVPGGSLPFDLSKGSDATKKLKKIEVIAFVDAETRLPVEVRSRGESRVFQFDPPPTQMQTLPAELIAQIRKGDEARTRLNQPAPRPY